MNRAALGVAPFALAVTLGLAPCACGSKAPAAPNWQLSWSDEFTEAALDGAGRTVDTGDSFGTGQEDYDTARPANVNVTGGNLVPTAQSESYQGASYTSGRIETGGKFAQAYGRFEARIRIPGGQGLWPAFWLLGDDYAQDGWPQCGELDIMEARGAVPGTALGSMHGPGGDLADRGVRIPPGSSFSDDFHLFALEWEPGVARWSVDGQLYETQSAGSAPRHAGVGLRPPLLRDPGPRRGGGRSAAQSRGATTLPQSMLVDYVRVYVDGGSPLDAGASD